jgi:hypothetical protein
MIDHLSAAPSVLLQGFDQVDDLRLLRAVRDRDSGFLGHFQKFVLRELRQGLVAAARAATGSGSSKGIRSGDFWNCSRTKSLWGSRIAPVLMCLNFTFCSSFQTGVTPIRRK